MWLLWGGWTSSVWLRLTTSSWVTAPWQPGSGNRLKCCHVRSLRLTVSRYHLSWTDSASRTSATHGRPQELLRDEAAKSTCSLSSPSLPVFPFLSFPPIPLPLALSTLPMLLGYEANPFHRARSLWEHCDLLQSGLRQTAPAATAIRYIFETVKSVCGNDFGSFCTYQNVVIEANVAFYIFPGG